MPFLPPNQQRQSTEGIICSKLVIKNPTTSCICCQITLWNINVRKRAINAKLQGSVATNLRCDMVINSQIKESLLLSLPVKKLRSVNIWHSYKQEEWIRWLSRALCAPGHHTAESRRKCTAESPFFPVTMPNIRRFKKNSPVDLATNHSNHSVRLLKISPHLKYVTTYNLVLKPYVLSLIIELVCDCRSFSAINVSQ